MDWRDVWALRLAGHVQLTNFFHSDGASSGVGRGIRPHGATPRVHMSERAYV